jgi:hypothetical protein
VTMQTGAPIPEPRNLTGLTPPDQPVAADLWQARPKPI